VAELPHFEQVRAAYAKRKVKVLLVSLDYASQLDKKVRHFVQKRGLKSEVWLLKRNRPKHLDGQSRRAVVGLPALYPDFQQQNPAARHL
jgi:hypothetical protein